MAKDFWDKLKISSEAYKNFNWKFIVVALTMVSGWSTGGYHWLDKIAIQEKTDKAIHEVAVGFQKAMTEIEPKQIVVKASCSKCGGYFENIVDKKINDYSVRHIDKSH